MTRTFWLLVLLTVFAGCDDDAPVPPPAAPSGSNAAGAPGVSNTAPSPAPSTAAPIDAKQATGVWNQSQVEGWLRETLKLTSLTLSKTGGDNYTGEATGADGNNYQLKVTQVPGGIACRYTFGTGGRGRVAFGNAVMD